MNDIFKDMQAKVGCDYISDLPSYRPAHDPYGNVYIVVDMELKGLIREALIKMILAFDIALEIEEE